MALSKLEIVEQPADDLEDLAEVRRRTGLRIAADEIGGRGRRRAPRRRGSDACDIATVKLAKVGGIVAAREIAAEIPVYLSSALDGPVGIAAAVHAAQAIDDRRPAHGLATARALHRDDRRPRVQPRRRPALGARGAGLGVEIDERAAGGAARLVSLAVDPTNRNTALASAFAEELARAGVAPRGHLSGVAVHAARGGALAPARDRGLRPSSTSAAPASSPSAPRRRRTARSRSSAPRARRRPTSIPPWSRPTSRACR